MPRATGHYARAPRAYCSIRCQTEAPEKAILLARRVRVLWNKQGRLVELWMDASGGCYLVGMEHTVRQGNIARRVHGAVLVCVYQSPCEHEALVTMLCDDLRAQQRAMEHKRNNHEERK
jgi:hypothetical protein